MCYCLFMRLIIRMLILFWLVNSVSLQCLFAQSSHPLTIVTEDLYPFNYPDGDEVKGSSTDKVIEALSLLDLAEEKITILPWPRAYSRALNEENILIYSILRTKEREDLFKWVAKVGEMRVGVMKLKSRPDIQINEMNKLSDYKMAVFVDSPLQEYLLKRKIPITNLVGKYESVIHLLNSGRVDLVPGSVVAFLSTARKLGIVDKFEVAYYFDDLGKDLYVAFSKKTSDEMVNKFRKAFEKVNINN